MTKQYHFMSGLPRSGSTLLASILNQNPEVYVTPTSPMLNVAVSMQRAWDEDPTVKANRFPEQINNLTKAILPAFWEHRTESIIIDKGRGWTKNVPNATKLFNQKIKLIINVRDLPSIMASWLSIIEKQPGCAVDQNVIRKGFSATNENRMAEMWFGLVKDCMEGLQQVKREAPDQILLVDYDDLSTNPDEVIKRIESFLDLPPWEYDLNNIQNDTVDDDLVAWGIEGLHTIRPQLKKISRPAIEVLGEELFNRFIELEKQYV